MDLVYEGADAGGGVKGVDVEGHVVGAGVEEDNVGAFREGEVGVGGYLGYYSAGVAFIVVVCHVARFDLLGLGGQFR